MPRVFYLFWIVSVGVSLMAPVTKIHADSLLNDIMPSVFGPRDRNPKPEKTLIAPFAQDHQGTRTVQANETSTLEHPENLISITMPNHERGYIVKWSDDIVARVMTYNPENAAVQHHQDRIEREKLLKDSFLPSSLSGVNTVFQDPYFQERLIQKSMRVQAFVETSAIIQNEGAFGGTYRWLVDVPVTITFFPQGDVQYKTTDTKRTTYETKKIVIRLQIGRVARLYPEGIAIESFTLRDSLP